MSDADKPSDAVEPTDAVELTDAGGADAPADAPTVAPKPRPSTSAASRARRIGGGTAPTPARPPAPRSSPATPESGPDAEPTVRLGKKSGKGASEAASAATPAPDAGDDTGPRTRRTVAVPAWLAWAPAVAFFVVAAVFLALLLVNRLGSDDESSTTSSKTRETVLAATKNCVAATNTYKYTDIDRYEAAGVACTTGQYTKQYSNAMNTLIKKNAPVQQFTQIAKVTSAGVESVSKTGKQWSILVYGQLNITNKTQPKGRIDPFGLVATMTQAKGKWVVERITLLTSAS